MQNLTIAADEISQEHTPGSRTDYLAQIATDFPERDSLGYVIGHYVYDGDKRIADAKPHRADAQAMMDEHPRRTGSWSIVCGHVFTATSKTIQVTD